MGSDWTPRPAQPYQPGNLERVTHGAGSERMIAARAEIVRSELLDFAPWLAEPEFAPAVARWLRAEARALMIHEHIERVTAAQGAGKVAVRLWEQATAADRLAAQLGNVLGLDPLGKARLKQAAAGAIHAEASLADLAAAGQAALARRSAAPPEGGQEPLAGLPVDDDRIDTPADRTEPARCADCGDHVRGDGPYCQACRGTDRHLRLAAEPTTGESC
jgi:hypothetical protein